MKTLYARLSIADGMTRDGIVEDISNSRETQKMMISEMPEIPEIIGADVNADDPVTEEMMRDSFTNLVNVIMNFPLDNQPKVDFEELEDKDGNVVLRDAEFVITGRGINTEGEKVIICGDLAIAYEIVD